MIKKGLITEENTEREQDAVILDPAQSPVVVSRETYNNLIELVGKLKAAKAVLAVDMADTGKYEVVKKILGDISFFDFYDF